MDETLNYPRKCVIDGQTTHFTEYNWIEMGDEIIVSKSTLDMYERDYLFEKVEKVKSDGS